MITNQLDDALVPSVAIAHPGHGPSGIMKNGEPTLVRKKGSKPELAPRTALGLSADERWLYALVVDGRQKGYSDGADMEDLIAVMKAAGASDAINMDGGGSSTLVFWDEEKKSAVIPNRHDAKRQSYRPVDLDRKALRFARLDCRHDEQVRRRRIDSASDLSSRIDVFAAAEHRTEEANLLLGRRLHRHVHATHPCYRHIARQSST